MAERRPRLGRTVVAIGLVSLLTDAATEMAMPLLPLFLTTTLGAGAVALGAVEGLADGTAAVLKLWSGRRADKTRRNRPLVLAGYGISSLVRPLLALTMTPLQVVLVRVGDRVGKGLRSSPRDALLTAAVAPEHRGAAFGFHRAMDHAGAVIGPLIAVALLSLFHADVRTIFALTAIPGALAVLAIVLGVREQQPVEAPRPAGPPVGDLRPLWRLLIPVSLFTLGNASDTFLLLKAGAVDSAPTTLPLLWMALHVVKSASSLLGGRLVDHWGPRATTAAGWLVYVACYAGLAVVDDPIEVAALVVVYGVYHGLAEPAEKALVASMAPPARRGEAFGRYHLAVGLGAVPASLGFGLVWDAWGATTAFGVAGALAAAALASLLVLVPRQR